MASPVPAKSQPLHNFSLPLLKWNKNHTTTTHHHRGRTRPPDSSPPLRRLSPLPPGQSPARDSASYSESGSASETRKSSKKPATAASEFNGGGAKEVRSPKNCIRPCTNNKGDDEEEKGKTGCGEENEVEEESAAKTWNLRPRKPIRRPSNGNGLQENKTPIRPESIRCEAEGEEKKEKKKQKFSIALSRREIEEDVFAITGSKPARRPKKRVKIVQKQLDNLFPGLWLASITPDSYKVSDAPAKG